MRELQNSSFKYFYNFQPHKIFSPIFTQGDIQSRKSFASNKYIIITKPDKDRGVVIVLKIIISILCQRLFKIGQNSFLLTSLWLL